LPYGPIARRVDATPLERDAVHAAAHALPVHADEIINNTLKVRQYPRAA